jgi:hypothetical protein
MPTTTVRLFQVASRIKTPLALAGGSLVLLYAVYHQVLALPVFSQVGAQPTFVLLQGVLNKMFWFALVALILGVGSYIFTAVLKQKLQNNRSSVALIDASLDPHDSAYLENRAAGVTTIVPAPERKSRDRN